MQSASNPEDVILQIGDSSKVDSVVPHCGCTRDGGALCFFVGTVTSPGAICATLAPDSKNMDVPLRVCWSSQMGASFVLRFCVTAEKGVVLRLLLDRVAKECRLEGQGLEILRQVSPTQSHQSNGAAEKDISTVRGLAHTYLAVLKDKIASVDVMPYSTMLPWTIRHAVWVLTRYNVRRDTHDTTRENSWTDIQERDPATG